MPDPQKRVDHKAFDFGGRHWDIGRFDAQTGSYIAYKLAALMAPSAVGALSGGPEEALAAALAKGVPTMSKADFKDLQNDCLDVCRELLDSGPVSVRDENGKWAVQDLDHDPKTVMALTIQALVFNVSDFFDAGLLSSLGEMLGMRPPDAKTSASSSTRR